MADTPARPASASCGTRVPASRGWLAKPLKLFENAAYAGAVSLAPDLPAAYCSWGAALARHGDLDGAIVKLKAANQRGLHWADPLKVWGEVLVKQGHPQEALEKYDEALRYAPNWKQLKEAREAVAKQRS
jgi:tetratricopeptide (TPR) repeat protein